MVQMMTGMINNIFFIIFPIVLYQMFAPAGKRNFFVSHRITLTVLFSFSILLCMFFPYQFLTDDYIFDLRQVPMIVGALYGGPLVSAILFIVSAIGRIVIGGDGMYIAILNQLLIAAGVPLLRPFYMRIHRTGKVGFVFFITFLSFLFNLLAGYFLFGDPIHDLFDIWLLLMLNQGAVIALAALLIEHILRQEYMLSSLMKHEKLETVSHFAASVSHELRNPLQSIKGFLQLMQEQEYSREKQLEFQKTMLQEIEAADQLINDYLVFAKPVQRQLKVLKVKPEIEQVLKVLKPYAHWQKVELRMAEYNGTGQIRADQQKFHQALINIIRNGIEAMPGGGTFKIEIQEKQQKLIIKLSDAGIGMTKEEIQRLGEPYFSTKTKGTGLGMMVAYSIIRQMGGDIQVESEKGKGTSFTLTFPMAR